MKNGKMNFGALSLAVCVFIQSTAFGMNSWVKDDPFVYCPGFDAPEKELPIEFVSNLNESNTRLAPPNGGPDQPEVQSFTPIGTSDMVDPFTGDFSYNIPLMDVDGYPINIAYSAGVTMDQEASWVGLGWNLNPGVVNRSMRGIPDEFNGVDTVRKEMNLRRNWTVGGSVRADVEIFGGTITDVVDGGVLNASFGINYNNYNGFGSNISFGLNAPLGNNFSAGLGFSGSSTGGASLSPTIGYVFNSGEDEKKRLNSFNLASPFNSRSGLERMTMSYTRTEKDYKVKEDDEVLYSFDKNRLNASTSFNFGQSTYTPVISMPMKTAGGTFSYKFGPDIFGADATATLSGSYTSIWLKEKDRTEKAYGYFNLEKGQLNENGMLDFNREKDGPFTKNTPALPIPNLTYDVFSVSGQGVAGSYRPVRKDIGHVFDAKQSTGSVNGSLGIEAGIGASFKAGIDISATYSNSQSGDWDDNGNKAKNTFKYGGSGFYFREASELAVDADPDHFDEIGGSKALRFDVKSHRRINNKLIDLGNNTVAEQASYTKSGTDRRNQVMYMLTNAEVASGLGIEPLHPQSFYALASDQQRYAHHIGQFTVLNDQGSRYVYGIAAYSHKQESTSFAAESLPPDCSNGTIVYTPEEDNTINNDRGVDNYYNNVITPAFSHSFLLTTVLNADYVDADNIKGPSKGDLGGYLKFSYKKIDNYKWRNPAYVNRASYDEGFNSHLEDDKGHYIYGEKELWYVDTIRSKNHIAIFHFSDREDGYSVQNRNGGLDLNGPRMQKLDSISLYSLPEYEANPNTDPLKRVHFEYSYDLCPGFEGNPNGGGKLTLESIYFTYEGSYKGKRTPYIFEYGQYRDEQGNVVADANYSYHPKAVDRWNNYKKPVLCSGQHDVAADPLRPSDFPYVGFDQDETDMNMTAWNLTTIELPSGGRIEVDYESDDYAFVQHKRANNMLKIVAVQGYQETNNPHPIVSSGTTPLSGDNFENSYLFFEMIPGYTNAEDYVQVGQRVYFRALLKMEGGYDFVPGYAFVEEVSTEILNGQQVGRILLRGENLDGTNTGDYNPITVAGIQFARLYLSKFIPPSSQSPVNENANLVDLINSLGGAFASLQELFIGPNKPLFNANVGTQIEIGKSWLRLNNANKKKLGGGHRVKEIRMYDSWYDMTDHQMDEYHYGQSYEYVLEDGTSSGVASYEPQLGGDENPWKQPIYSTERNLLAPDQRNYTETPFGEQFFPAARVGYSRVTIKDLSRTNVNRNATGKVVHEFYTAKDFPTLVNRTPVESKRFRLPAFAVFFSSIVDEMAASQGFVVENNDMHGKAKSQSVYQQGQNQPITKVEYFYQSEPIVPENLVGSALGLQESLQMANHLTNKVTTIDRNGQISTSTVGLNYEAVADFRKSTSNTISGTGQFNINFTAPFILIPTLMGSGSYERTAFRSATFTKVIERFGILEKTVATDLGSQVETNNVAYDAETGVVLLTQTTTDFNDDVYNFTYPAHWYYDQMGQAYKNIGKGAVDLTFVNGGTGEATSNIFSRGDEVAYLQNNNYHLAWVVEAGPYGIKVLNKDGSTVEGFVDKIKILRSGRRNLQTTPVGTVALRSNPLNNLSGNVFDKVLQAGAVEYSDDWRTFCECFLNEQSDNFTKNPYVLGIRGTWRPKASYVHLSGRTQTYENGNSNIREDGIFTSFTPFYQLDNGMWNINKRNWTYTSSVTEFSPFGQALETIDALDRYSASMFGYNQTLPTAVAANTRYRQLGYDGFEDYEYDNCSDDHFKLGEGAEIVSNEAHTGRKSVRVTPQTPVSFTKPIIEGCEDDTPCSLSSDQNTISVGKEEETTVAIIGGTAPYFFNVFNQNGDPILDFNENGTGFIVTKAPEESLEITVTDALGCELIIQF